MLEKTFHLRLSFKSSFERYFGTMLLVIQMQARDQRDEGIGVPSQLTGGVTKVYTGHWSSGTLQFAVYKRP